LLPGPLAATIQPIAVHLLIGNRHYILSTLVVSLRIRLFEHALAPKMSVLRNCTHIPYSILKIGTHFEGAATPDALSDLLKQSSLRAVMRQLFHILQLQVLEPSLPIVKVKSASVLHPIWHALDPFASIPIIYLLYFLANHTRCASR
jgi:hypothetical protein